jgi:hypothetical protein
MHGGSSGIWKSELKLPDGPIIIESELGTESLFFQVRVESEAFVLIDSIKIEYVDPEE